MFASIGNLCVGPASTKEPARRKPTPAFQPQRMCLLRAITVLPRVPNSARLDDVAEPQLSDGTILVRTIALGVCGTDREIVAGEYGEAPPASERLVLGHES